MLKIIILSSCFCFVADLNAQSVSSLMGARAAGLAYASATLSDVWSAVNNAAGLAEVKVPSAAIAQEISPALEGANRTALSLSSPVLKGTAGLSVFRFGDSFYNEQIVAAAYASRIGIASVGFKVNYIQYHTDGFATRRALALGCGVITVLTPVLSVGAYISNLNQPILSKSDHEQLPVQLSAGMNYHPSPLFLFVVEAEKDLDYNPVYKAACEFSLHQKLLFRTGFNMHPSAAFFGIGFICEKLKVDYALQSSTALGAAHQLSVVYRYEKRKL